MSRLSTIRNILAGLFLVIFAFSITPRRTLHNLIAHHKDGRMISKVKYSHQAQLDKAGFNCKCDNLISESPFVADMHSLFTLISSNFISVKEKTVVSFYSSDIYCLGLRGPPAC